MGNLICWISLVTGLGCGDDFLSSLPEVQAIAVCVKPTNGWEEAPGPTTEVSITGQVTERGVGDDGVGCFDPPFVGWGAPASGAKWGRIDDAGQSWTVAVLMDGLSFPDVGSDVAVTFAHARGGFSPSTGNFLLQESGSTRAWMGLGAGLDDLVLPDTLQSVSRGKTVYREEDECGTWEAFEIEVRTLEDVVTLEYGEQETEDDDVLFHGGYRHDLGKSSCPDWFVADVSLGWRVK